MEENGKNLITKEGYDEKQGRLNYLKFTMRDEIAQRIAEARSQGDLSENAEYDAAMDEQRDIEAEIAKLENELKNSQVVEEENRDHTRIGFGSKVEIQKVDAKGKPLKNTTPRTVTIKGTSEHKPLEGIISNVSPLGQALIGKKKDDIVDVNAPNGEIKYKIISFENSGSKKD